LIFFNLFLKLYQNGSASGSRGLLYCSVQNEKNLECIFIQWIVLRHEGWYQNFCMLPVLARIYTGSRFWHGFFIPVPSRICTGSQFWHGFLYFIPEVDSDTLFYIGSGTHFYTGR